MQSIEVDQPFHHDGWTYEEKYDGWRMIAYKDGRHVQLISRAGKDHSHRFADLAAAIRTLPPVRLILDGGSCDLRRPARQPLRVVPQAPRGRGVHPAPLHGLRLPVP